jgi:hypothetical protein
MRKASAEKDTHTNDDRRNNHYGQGRRRCGTGRARRAGEGAREEGRQPEEGRAQGQEIRQKGAKQGAKTKAAPKKAAKEGAKASKKAAKSDRQAAAPRPESKGAKILEMIGRAKGATLAEIMKATEWQAHSVRGFISTAGKKHGVKIESTKNDAGERTYKIAK